MGRLVIVGVRGRDQEHIQMRRSDRIQLAVADVAQLGNPIFGILRTISLLWLFLCQSLNRVDDRTADLILLSQGIKN